MYLVIVYNINPSTQTLIQPLGKVSECPAGLYLGTRHDKHTDVSNSTGRICVTLNIAFAVSSPRRLVMFLFRHTPTGNGLWVLSLSFSVAVRLLREILRDGRWEVFGRKLKIDSV